MGTSAGESFTTLSSRRGPWDGYRARTARIRSASRWVLQRDIPLTAVRVSLPAALPRRRSEPGNFAASKATKLCTSSPETVAPTMQGLSSRRRFQCSPASRLGWLLAGAGEILEVGNGTSERDSASEIEVLAPFACDRAKLGLALRSSRVKWELQAAACCRRGRCTA